MSHRHYCDAAGHDWYCDGRALRPDAGDTKPSVCMCLRHQVPMEQCDHSACPVELLACPQHRDEQQRNMDEAAIAPCDVEPDAEMSVWRDKDGKPIVGFCLWCNVDFYTMDEVWAHNANGSAACEAFQEFKNEQSMPTTHQVMPEMADE
jgi:hypothetical protein